jgi:hypothetical protein
MVVEQVYASPQRKKSAQRNKAALPAVPRTQRKF